MTDAEEVLVRKALTVGIAELKRLQDEVARLTADNEAKNIAIRELMRQLDDGR